MELVLDALRAMGISRQSECPLEIAEALARAPVPLTKEAIGDGVIFHRTSQSLRQCPQLDTQQLDVKQLTPDAFVACDGYVRPMGIQPGVGENMVGGVSLWVPLTEGLFSRAHGEIPTPCYNSVDPIGPLTNVSLFADEILFTRRNHVFALHVVASPTTSTVTAGDLNALANCRHGHWIACDPPPLGLEIGSSHLSAPPEPGPPCGGAAVVKDSALSSDPPYAVSSSVSTSAGPLSSHYYPQAFGVFICAALDMLAIVADDASDPEDRLTAEMYMYALSLDDEHVLYPQDFLLPSNKRLINLFLLAGRLGGDVDACTAKILDLATHLLSGEAA